MVAPMQTRHSRVLSGLSEGESVARKVADLMWEMLAKAGVKRCCGIVGDALNPVIDALRRNGKIEFIHVRHEGIRCVRRRRRFLSEGQPRRGMRNRRTG